MWLTTATARTIGRTPGRPGVGATRSSSDNWLGHVSAFDQLLSSLNQGQASASPSPPPGAAEDNEEATTATIAVTSTKTATKSTTTTTSVRIETKRNQLYRKRLKHKDLRTYKEKDMLEIFATAKVTKLANAVRARVRKWF